MSDADPIKDTPARCSVCGGGPAHAPERDARDGRDGRDGRDDGRDDERDGRDADDDGGGTLLCAHCSERFRERWRLTSDRRPLSTFLARRSVSAFCVFWQPTPLADIKAVRCEGCVDLRRRHCNLPFLGKDPHNIIPGRCGAFDSCCDGNLIVERRGIADERHSTCRTYRRRRLLASSARLRILSE